jgi:hypothetical protein
MYVCKIWVPNYLTLVLWPTTRLHETWCLYHGAWAQLNGVHNEYLLSFCSPYIMQCSVTRSCGIQYKSNNRTTDGLSVYCAVCFVSKESLWDLSVYHLIVARQPLRKRIFSVMSNVGGIVLCAVHVLSNKNGRLIFPRASFVYLTTLLVLNEYSVRWRDD